MQIVEAWGLKSWVEGEIEDLAILECLQRIQSILQSNSVQNNQPSTPFAAEVAEFNDKCEGIRFNRLTQQQIDALERLGIYQNVGSRGIAKLDSILDNTMDIATATDAVGAMASELAEGTQAIINLGAAVEPLIDDNIVESNDGEILARITFAEDAAIDDIQKLQAWAKQVYVIGLGFTGAIGKQPQDIRVVGAGNGSIYIEIASLVGVYLMMSKAVNITLDNMIKLRSFKLLGLQIRTMKAENPEIADEIEKEAKVWDQRAEKFKEDLAEQVSKDVRAVIDGFNKKNEANFDRGVRALVDLHTKGGTIDWVLPGEVGDDEVDDMEPDTRAQVEQLRSDFARIRDLRETLQIQHLPHNEDEFGVDEANDNE